jgi:hypothetical protein
MYPLGTVFTDIVEERMHKVNKATKADAVIVFVLPSEVLIVSLDHT